jgi:cytochrome c oxidase assembly protein Cox11
VYLTSWEYYKAFSDIVLCAAKKEPRMVPKKEITVRFNANVIDRLPWSFVPSQNEVEVVPGETVLAFYKAENKSETPIIGKHTDYGCILLIYFIYVRRCHV